MSGIEVRIQQLCEEAAKFEVQNGSEAGENLKHIQAFWDMISSNSFQSMILASDPLGRETVRIVLSKGVRQDKPKMEFAESVILEVGSKRSGFRVFGQTKVVPSRTSQQEFFSRADQARVWALTAYSDHTIEGVEGDTPLNIMVTLSRSLDPGKLVVSHGGRTEEWLRSIEGFLGVK